MNESDGSMDKDKIDDTEPSLSGPAPTLLSDRKEEPHATFPARKFYLILIGFLVFVVLVLGWFLIECSNLPVKSTLDSAGSVYPIDRNELKHRIDTIIKRITCADLRTQLSDNLELQIEGHIANDTVLDRLKMQLAELAPVKVQHYDVKPGLARFCDLLALFRAFQSPENSAGERLVLRLNNPDGVYRNGENLVVKIIIKTPFDGYLYIDYYDADENVVHLLPTLLRPENKLKSDNSLILGEPDRFGESGYNTYEIVPPFGTQMITAIFSETPLYSELRPIEETRDTYYGFLQSRLREVSSEHKLDLVFVFFTSQP